MLQTPWCRGIYSLLPNPCPGGTREGGGGGEGTKDSEMSLVLFCFVWIDFFVFFIFLLSLVRSVLSIHFIISSHPVCSSSLPSSSTSPLSSSSCPSTIMYKHSCGKKVRSCEMACTDIDGYSRLNPSPCSLTQETRLSDMNRFPHPNSLLFI